MKKIAIILTILLASLTIPVAFAATGVYLGSGNVNWANGDIDFDIRGYVYYNSNTSTTLDVYSLAQWIYNYGNFNVDEYEFSVYNGSYSKSNIENDDIINPVKTNESKRIETVWSTVTKNTSYTKDGTGNTKVVVTNILSGNTMANTGGWTTYWYPSSYESVFHK